MPKLQFYIIGAAILFLIVLFQFPKALVHNFDPNEQPTSNATEESSSENPSQKEHNSSLNEEQKKIVERLIKSFENTEDKEKRIIFADSLASIFAAAYQFDKSAEYKEIIAELQPSLAHHLASGNAFYEAFKFETDAKLASKFSEKARTYYQKVLKENPKNYEAKVKMGVTYVTTKTPMQGISIIREVLAEDPNNELALLNIGILSIQSQQYDKAIERFETLLKNNPQNEEAKYYLAESYMSTGKVSKAKEIFGDLVKTAKDSLIQSAAKEYLQTLK